jgi:hypothetical protein
MAIRLVKLYNGKVKRVLMLALDDDCPAQDFLNEASSSNPKGYRTLVSRIHAISETPNLLNSEIFKHERDGIYVWRTSCGYRLYAFHDAGHVIIAVNGGDKRSYKKQTRDIDRAIAFRTAYHSARDNPKVEIPIIDSL